MPVVRVKGVANPMQFPDDMDINDIKAFLRRKFAQQAVTDDKPADLAPLQGQARATEQSLAQKAGQGISNALVDSGIISDRFGAQQIGKNVTSIGEFLPGIGDAAAGDEFGRALKQGDGVGMALGALGAIPLVGDAAKKAVKSTAKAMSAGGITLNDLKDVPYREQQKIAKGLQTGQPVEFYYSRNLEKAPKITGMDFGQSIEPAGRYMNVDFTEMSGGKNWETGTIKFNNPLVVEHKNTNSTGWKKDLSDKYGGSVGKRLSNKVKKDGYDAIITVDDYGLSETISLR
jgi:hypothetical protein